MSSHYILTFSVRLRSDLSDEDMAGLDYLIAGEGPCPTACGPLLGSALNVGDLSQFNDPGLSGVSRLAKIRNASGSLEDLYLHLYAPGLKIDSVHEDAISLARWFASLAKSDGYLGSIICEDEQSRLPLQFFSYGGELHATSSAKVVSFATHKEREIRVG